MVYKARIGQLCPTGLTQPTPGWGDGIFGSPRSMQCWREGDECRSTRQGHSGCSTEPLVGPSSAGADPRSSTPPLPLLQSSLNLPPHQEPLKEGLLCVTPCAPGTILLLALICGHHKRISPNCMVQPNVPERPRSSDKVCRELPWDHHFVNRAVRTDAGPVEVQNGLVLSSTPVLTGGAAAVPLGRLS